MLDRAAFLRPIAHRGLHGKITGHLENTAPAFAAAFAKGYGVECDLQPASDGTPMVFHDFTLDRLVDAVGRIDRRSPSELATTTYRGRAETILSFAEFLDLAGGRGPLLVEIKSDWKPPHDGFLQRIARSAKRYKGPLALMSFDPKVMVTMAELAPKVPRGIVSGVYAGDGWNLDKLGTKRGERLTNLLESGAALPSFFAYDVKALPTPITRYVREVQGLPLFTWTVRSATDRKTAMLHADAPIFEGFEA